MTNTLYLYYLLLFYTYIIYDKYLLGDEILAVNGQLFHDLTHSEAVSIFKNIKCGPIALHISRRVRTTKP